MALRFHFTPVRMAITKKTTNSVEDMDGKKGILIQCWWDYKLIQLLQKSVWRYFKKSKLSYGPVILLLCTSYTYTPMFITELFTVTMICDQLRCPTTTDWIKKMW
jgi:hypothetical protein